MTATDEQCDQISRIANAYAEQIRYLRENKRPGEDKQWQGYESRVLNLVDGDLEELEAAQVHLRRLLGDLD